MSISEEKMKIVINNYFKSECDVNTSIREAFEKGFRIGVKKGLAQSIADTPQTDLSIEEFVEGMKNLKMEVKQTDCGWK
jgi:hypothetical protein